MGNTNLKKFIFVSLMIFVVIVFVPLMYSFLMNLPMNSPKLEHLILTYNGSNKLVYVEYKPGSTALFLNPKKFVLIVTPTSENESFVKLNFTLELYGDAVLGRWPNHFVKSIVDLKSLASQLNITQNFSYIKHVIVDYDVRMRVAYINGSNIGILPFGITNIEDNVVITSIWLQDINSEKLNLSLPPKLVVTAEPTGNSTLDFSKGTAITTIDLKFQNGTNMHKRISKDIKSLEPLPRSYQELMNILKTSKLEFVTLSNISASYPFFHLSFTQVEKFTGIPLYFSLSGGPKLLVKEGNYTFNGKPVKDFPISPLAYFLGLRNFDYIDFYLVSVERK